MEGSKSCLRVSVGLRSPRGTDQIKSIRTQEDPGQATSLIVRILTAFEMDHSRNQGAKSCQTLRGRVRSLDSILRKPRRVFSKESDIRFAFQADLFEQVNNNILIGTK